VYHGYLERSVSVFDFIATRIFRENSGQIKLKKLKIIILKMTNNLCGETNFCPNAHRKYADSAWCATCEADRVFERIEPAITTRGRGKFLQNFQVYQTPPSRKHVLTRFVVQERYITPEPQYVTDSRVFFALGEYVKPLASAARAGNTTFAIVCFLLRYFTSDADMVPFATLWIYKGDLRIKL
jgi:hypothetical protein